MSEEDINEEFTSPIEPEDDTVEVEEQIQPPIEEDLPEKPKYTEQEVAMYKRAKKAEAEAKDAKQKLAELEKAKNLSTSNDNSESVDEKILRSTKGYDDETMDKLKVVAKGLDSDLFKAESDELFQDYLAKKQAEERKEKAKLGSSKGSQVSEEVKIGSLSREEHQEAFKEIMSKVN